MFIKTKFLALSAALCLGLACSGCSFGKAQPADAAVSEVSIREAVTRADPQKAIEAIYSAFPEIIHQEMTPEEYSKSFGDVADLVEEYHIHTSSPNNGLGEVIFIRPAQSQEPEQTRDQVREAIHQYKEKRIKEFENYDILDSYTIARDSVIYDQGDYLILVMFADNEAVQDIIDDHIPM